MPQRQFWTERHPMSFQATYSLDPTHPQDPPGLLLSVSDQARVPMVQAFHRLPFNVIHEAFLGAVTAGWECYLFGVAEDLPKCSTPIVEAWRRESAARGG